MTFNVPISNLPPGSTPTGAEVLPAVQNGTTVKLTVYQIVNGGADQISIVTNEEGQISIGSLASGAVTIGGVNALLGSIFNGQQAFIIASGSTGDVSEVSVTPLGYVQGSPLNKLLGGQAPITLAPGSTGDITDTTVTVSGTPYTMSYLMGLLLSL